MITESLGSYVILFVVENAGRYHVVADHWDELDAAYHHWIERRIDRVLSVICTDGGQLLIAASRIAELCMLTLEIRERARAIDAALKAEQGFSE